MGHSILLLEYEHFAACSVPIIINVVDDDDDNNNNKNNKNNNK